MSVTKKKIVSVKVIKPASNPDVDSDFGSKNKDEVLRYVQKTYGHENVANITTFGTNASRLAFKDSCNIYEIPFEQANRISSLIPDKATLNSLYDENSEFYEVGADFRSATSGKQWEKVIASARAREGRIKSTGVHACGIIISSDRLDNHIPLYVSKEGLFTTQWTYPECESLGLIKMDFLTLDTVDIIQQTLEYIMQGHDKGKIDKVPNMLKIIHNEMDDPKVYELFQKGETVGVFQFGSALVRELLHQMKPDRFGDLSACTAIARPGPMGMGSHTKYADRKNGREAIDYIHSDFNGSPLENILGDTYGLCIPEGTLILDKRRRAYVPIQYLIPGWSTTPSYNRETYEIEDKTVNHVIKTGKKKILKITLNDNVVFRVSETHPVMVADEFVPAKDITLDDYVAHVVDYYYLEYLRVKSIEEDGYEMCYDIEVEDNHNFLVNDVIVHNCVYQEQVMKISNEIAGMTLQEADVLRKAMGKKKKDVMDNMKKDFVAGALKNGYSLEAIEQLWETIAVFSLYAFNKSHSVSYAIMSYQAAYLKTYYPVEFITALINHKASKDTKDKKGIFEYLREAKRMNVNIGTVNINASSLYIQPDYEGTTGYDSIFGIAGITSVSSESASIILEERERNGLFKSVQDVIKRCVPLGLTNKAVYINLAQAGAFDCFNVSRKQVVENIPDLVALAKNEKKVGTEDNLFDIFEINDPIDSIELDGAEYPFSEKLKLEADAVGLYLTAHPMSRIGENIKNLRTSTINQMLEKNKTEEIIVGSIVSITEKGSGNTKSIVLDIEDNDGYLTARLDKKLVQGIEKNNARETIKKDYQDGRNDVNQQILQKAINRVPTIKPIEVNDVYIMKVRYQSKNDGYFATINKIQKLQLSDNGTLPIRIRIPYDSNSKEKAFKISSGLPKVLSEKYPGNHEIYIKRINTIVQNISYSDGVLKQMLKNMNNDNINKVDLIKRAEEAEEKKHKKIVGLDGGILETSKRKKTKKKFTNLRKFPPTLSPEIKQQIITNSSELSPFDIQTSLDNMEYEKTGYTCDKNQVVEQIIEKYVGYDNFDYGIQNIRNNNTVYEN